MKNVSQKEMNSAQCTYILTFRERGELLQVIVVVAVVVVVVVSPLEKRIHSFASVHEACHTECLSQNLVLLSMQLYHGINEYNRAMIKQKCASSVIVQDTLYLERPTTVHAA